MHRLTLFAALLFCSSLQAQDLVTPPMTEGPPAPSKRVRATLPAYQETEVHHALYLPPDWKPGARFPVIVEYAGNKYKEQPGSVEACDLGYGISGGKKFIWVSMPYISEDHQRNQVTWWGDVEATVAYCKAAVADICKQYGGDPEAVFITGFSRGAIACNFIGLHDDEIAALWKGFICHSHYDGIKKWGYPKSDRASAAVRLARLKGRAQFIIHEHSVAATQNYLREALPEGNFTFQALKGFGHTDAWVLHEVPERKKLRDWLNRVLIEK